MSCRYRSAVCIRLEEFIQSFNKRKFLEITNKTTFLLKYCLTWLSLALRSKAQQWGRGKTWIA
jgi:hypothetical protein